MTVFGWLVSALGAVTLFWAFNERRFRQRALRAAGRGIDGGQGPVLTWEQKMALVRRYELLNWAVAFSVVAILGGFIWVAHSYYEQLRMVTRSPEPPEITVPGQETPGPSEATVLRWEARYPGGRLWAVVADGGYVLFRTNRSRFDQYLLYGPTGKLLWQGERSESVPAPRAALGSTAGRANLAVELAGGGAHLRVFTPDGELLEEGATLPVFPVQDWAFRMVATGSGAGVKQVSPDGEWHVAVTTSVTTVNLSSRAKVYGPRPGP